MEPRLWIAAQLSTTTALQTGFYLPLYSILFYSAFIWSGYEKLYRNIFNKLAVYSYFQYLNCKYWNLLKDTSETETEGAEKSSWDQANRGEKLGLVWRNRKKISQIINDYLYLPFFLLIILWSSESIIKRRQEFS